MAHSSPTPARVSAIGLISRIDRGLAALPEAVIAGAGALSLMIYARVIVPTADLAVFRDARLLDLSAILKGSAPAALRLLGWFALLFVLYGLAARAARHTRTRVGWLLVISWAALFGLALLRMYPFAAADIFDNIMHGRILGVYGGNPFFNTASQYPNDPFLNYSFWVKAISAYGPAWEASAGLAARLAGNDFFSVVRAFKLLPGLFLFASMAAAALILRREAPERALSAVLLLGWNPMMQFETFGNGHNDIAMAFWILAAVWLITRRRFTLAVLALVMGALFKYIPLLLLPAAGLIGLREQTSGRARVRYFALTALAVLALVVLAYAPFWVGPGTLTVERRAQMFTSSIPTLIYHALGSVVPPQQAGRWISGAAAALTGLFALFQGVRAWRDRSWLSFPRAALYTLMFYLLLATPWFMVWYPIWTLTLGVLFPFGFEMGFTLLFSFSVLFKPFVTRPFFLWYARGYQPWQREALLAGFSLGLPWLYTLIGLLRRRRPPKTDRSAPASS